MSKRPRHRSRLRARHDGQIAGTCSRTSMQLDKRLGYSYSIRKSGPWRKRLGAIRRRFARWWLPWIGQAMRRMHRFVRSWRGCQRRERAFLEPNRLLRVMATQERQSNRVFYEFPACVLPQAGNSRGKRGAMQTVITAKLKRLTLTQIYL
jgi:hypothetical protein